MRLARRITVALAVLALSPLPMLRAPDGANAVFSDSVAAGGNAFTTAASFCSSSPAGVKIVTGFEYGTYAKAADVANGSLIDGDQGTSPTVSSAAARTGTYSLYVNKAATTTDTLAWKYFDAAGTSSVVARVAIRLPSLPAADVTSIVDVWSSGEILRLGYVAGATKKFKLTWQTTAQTVTATTAALAANTWYVIDLKVTGGSPTSANWRVDGVDQPVLNRSSATTGFQDFEFGSLADTDVYTAYIDDLVVSTTLADYPLPDGGVSTLTPDAVTGVAGGAAIQDDAGTTVAVATPGAAAKLGGIPMTGTTSFVKHVNTTGTNYAEVSFNDTAAAGCVNAVGAVVAQHGSNATGGNGQSRIYDDAGNLQGNITTLAAITGTGIQYRTAPISPASGSWTVAKLNALRARVGYSTNATAANYPAWDSLMIEYDQG